MSARILAALDRSDFRRNRPAFKVAVFLTAMRKQLIAYDPASDVFINRQTGGILLGLLPDADGNWTVLGPAE